MKFSEQWLREWVQPNDEKGAWDTQQLCDQVTLAGLEVDGVEDVASDFSGVVVGQVVSREQHPDADKLSLCQVSDGTETFQIVCGAANVREGLKIPFAKIGAVLPTEDGKGFKIKKAKLRGVESFGMLCAEQELGMAESSDGLMELPESAPVGQDFREYMDLDDKIIEVDLTPNRADCLSIAGLAREVGVLSKSDVQGPVIEAVAPAIDDKALIEVTATEGCPRYLGRIVKGVNVKAETPLWMVEKLRRSGIRSIDPVVDITNYILLEQGQPMHAFDLAKVDGGIRVRMAEQGEKLTLLDGQEVELKDNTLVIADHNKALAIAGIMGGEHSGVNGETQDLLLEAAFFNPITIAGRARSYGLHTDSSHRFERGVDYELARNAMERATALVIEICGGQPGPIVEALSEKDLPVAADITLRNRRVKQVLGLEMAQDDITEILTRLGMDVSVNGSDDDVSWSAKAPSYRFDMAIEADLIEELARIYGYNRLPVRTPKAHTPLATMPEAKMTIKDLRRQLVARGYQEAITYSFVDPKMQKAMDPEVEGLALLNPISTEMSVMRTNLWAGLVGAVSHNLKRQQPRVRLFETGLRFVPTDVDGKNELIQTPTLALAVCGSRLPQSWSAQDEAVDFFDVKGDVETLLARTGEAEAYKFVAAQHPALHPGQTARIEKNGKPVGWIGAIHPSLQKQVGVKQTVYLVELDQEAIQQKAVPAFGELSKFPEMRRDLALVVKQEQQVEAVFAAIREQAGEYLTNLNLFDVYVGKGIDPDRKSLALGLTWQHPSRTLTDDEVNDSVNAVLAHLEQSLGATLRG
ncbi:phenylalanine--tRNA ligase subunit beta [Bacterioplanoides sp. SCSIO 12839]|uniref:phenylalanine--tRNA ligase subunit beta n=1 Tax=Bacterioplanoides sp. SCSIO 12839 TaxID=2829569 RepID=UPI0021033272|nr:phenylalanine--tRNA ligase subunit beta [Bacterioplanoides sp. SCSIO 12839]UTW49526.1 phenylalanine--tRNA ligase subunit beta [Bacterioplanoides sp. SCSIO 12839]